MANPRNFVLTSDYPIDEVFGTYSGSFFSPAPVSTGGGTTVTVNVTTNIPNSSFFVGVFSLDGGTTWQDFNSTLPRVAGGTNVWYQTFTMVGESQSNGTLVLKGLNYYDYLNSIGVSYTVMWKAALIAKANQPPLNLQSTGLNLYIDTDLNYRKILSETAQTLTSPATSTVTLTFPHNLGYKPDFDAYITGSTDTTNLNPTSIYSVGYSMVYGNVYYDAMVDETNVYIVGGNGSLDAYSANIIVRIYYDD